MQEQITQLRLKVDGLAQLVSELRPNTKFIIDINQVPNNIEIGKWVEEFEKAKYITIYSREDSKFNSFTPFPTQFKELENSYNALLLLKFWLGKTMEELKLEVTEDISGGETLFKDNFEILWYSTELNHPLRLNFIKSKIKEINQELYKVTFPNVIIYSSVYQNLLEAEFWLDQEIIRYNKEQK